MDRMNSLNTWQVIVCVVMWSIFSGWLPYASSTEGVSCPKPWPSFSSNADLSLCRIQTSALGRTFTWGAVVLTWTVSAMIALRHDTRLSSVTLGFIYRYWQPDRNPCSCIWIYAVFKFPSALWFCVFLNFILMVKRSKKQTKDTITIRISQWFSLIVGYRKNRQSCPTLLVKRYEILSSCLWSTGGRSSFSFVTHNSLMVWLDTLHRVSHDP